MARRRYIHLENDFDWYPRVRKNEAGNVVYRCPWLVEPWHWSHKVRLCKHYERTPGLCGQHRRMLEDNEQE